jgi:uroporphyrinogen-III decarboxylase
MEEHIDALAEALKTFAEAQEGNMFICMAASPDGTAVCAINGNGQMLTEMMSHLAKSETAQHKLLTKLVRAGFGVAEKGVNSPFDFDTKN